MQAPYSVFRPDASLVKPDSITTRRHMSLPNAEEFWGVHCEHHWIRISPPAVAHRTKAFVVKYESMAWTTDTNMLFWDIMQSHASSGRDLWWWWWWCSRLIKPFLKKASSHKSQLERFTSCNSFNRGSRTGYWKSHSFTRSVTMVPT